jgi:hypothetical protein
MVRGHERVGWLSSSELDSCFINAVAVQARCENQDSSARRPLHYTEETGGARTCIRTATYTYRLQKESSICVFPPQRYNDLRGRVSDLLIV